MITVNKSLCIKKTTLCKNTAVININSYTIKKQLLEAYTKWLPSVQNIIFRIK